MLTRMKTIDAGQMIRASREAAGLSIRDLAAAAGVAASTVLRVESGQMEPTVGIWERLMNATGQELAVTTTPARRPVQRIGVLTGAWRGSPTGGEPDWTRLRAFVDHLRIHPEETVLALRKRPRRSGSPVLDALLAGMAEKLAVDHGDVAPAWTASVAPLVREWAPPGSPRTVQRWRRATPPSLHRRGLVIDEGSLWRDRDTVGV